MNEVAMYRPDLIGFAEEAGQVHKIAQALAGTAFVPAAFAGRPDQITGAILFGRELGLSPMTSLQIINVIQGRPTISANGMRGLAMAHGVVFHLIEASDVRVVMRAKGARQDAWMESEWTIERARKMGLADKENWRKQPQAMLTARATSELCRLCAANLLIGLPYSAEEMTDLEPAPDLPVKATTRTVRRKPSYEPPSEPELAPADEVPPELEAAPHDWPEVVEVPLPADDVADDSPITMGTRKQVMAGFGELGVAERGARLSLVSGIVGRTVHSVNQLTEVEGRQVVEEAAAEVARRREVSSVGQGK